MLRNVLAVLLGHTVWLVLAHAQAVMQAHSARLEQVLVVPVLLGHMSAVALA